MRSDFYLNTLHQTLSGKKKTYDVLSIQRENGNMVQKVLGKKATSQNKQMEKSVSSSFFFFSFSSEMTIFQGTVICTITIAVSSLYGPVAPVVHLVTSKPSDVGTCVRISVSSQELVFFLTK